VARPEQAALFGEDRLQLVQGLAGAPERAHAQGGSRPRGEEARAVETGGGHALAGRRQPRVRVTEQLDQSEVQDLHDAVAPDHDVLRLEVTVDEAS
jgi:hypothetical protein